MSRLVTNEDYIVGTPLSDYQFCLSDLEKKIPENVSSIWHENAGEDHIRVMVEMDCFRRQARMVRKHQLTVKKDASNLLEMLCQKLEEVADDPWNQYDRVEFVRFIPA